MTSDSQMKPIETAIQRTQNTAKELHAIARQIETLMAQAESLTLPTGWRTIDASTDNASHITDIANDMEAIVLLAETGKVTHFSDIEPTLICSQCGIIVPTSTVNPNLSKTMCYLCEIEIMY